MASLNTLALTPPALSFDPSTRPATLLEAVRRQLERDRGALPMFVLQALQGLVGQSLPTIVAERIMQFEAYERDMLADAGAIRH